MEHSICCELIFWGFWPWAHLPWLFPCRVLLLLGGAFMVHLLWAFMPLIQYINVVLGPKPFPIPIVQTLGSFSGHPSLSFLKARIEVPHFLHWAPQALRSTPVFMLLNSVLLEITEKKTANYDIKNTHFSRFVAIHSTLHVQLSWDLVIYHLSVWWPCKNGGLPGARNWERYRKWQVPWTLEEICSRHAPEHLCQLRRGLHKGNWCEVKPIMSWFQSWR